jgi:hypothetical protein
MRTVSQTSHRRHPARDHGYLHVDAGQGMYCDLRDNDADLLTMSRGRGAGAPPPTGSILNRDSPIGAFFMSRSGRNPQIRDEPNVPITGTAPRRSVDLVGVSGTGRARAFEIISSAACSGIPHAIATDAASNPERPAL